MVGQVEAICPYCNSTLDEKPGRKQKCPYCQKFIFVRTSPKTGKKILVTDSEREIIEEQWSAVNGTHSEYKKNKNKIENERKSLKNKLGREPTENDIKWSLLNKELIENASSGNWGLYRNSKFAMAEILLAESKMKQALSMYLEVTYLDVNGPCNTSGYSSKEFPPFQKSDAMIAPGVINRISKLIRNLSLSDDDMNSIFHEIAETNYKNLKLPVKPDAAWKKIKKELF